MMKIYERDMGVEDANESFLKMRLFPSIFTLLWGNNNSEVFYGFASPFS